jgi:prolyl 4-hydroxylase
MNTGYNFKDCLGLKVKPRQGDALLFYSMHPNGTFDKVNKLSNFMNLFNIFSSARLLQGSNFLFQPQTALHGSCPVIKGEKWVATKWIRNTDKF